MIGTGYVGTVTAACFAWTGHEVRGVDVDSSRVQQPQAGVPFHEPGLDLLLTSALGRSARGSVVRRLQSELRLLKGRRVAVLGFSVHDPVVEDVPTEFSEVPRSAGRQHVRQRGARRSELPRPCRRRGGGVEAAADRPLSR